MGLYDTLFCRAKLPGTPPSFVGISEPFQTKDLDCEMATYEITSEGHLVRISGAWGTEPTRTRLEHFSEDVNFYTGNFRALANGMSFTEDGSDYEFVEYKARFKAGQLEEITEVGREREPALPVSSLRGIPKATKEDIERWNVRCSESLTGRAMYLHWGGREPEEGYAVRVAAENEKQIVVVSDAHGFEVLDRRQRDSVLFDSFEDAKKNHDERKAQNDADRAEYARQLAEKNPT